MKNQKVIYSLYLVITLSLYLLGTLTYLHSGEVWYDATYYTLQMFFMNYTPPKIAGPLLYFVRFACPVVTFTGLFSLMWGLVKKLNDRISLLFPDSTAIYYNAIPDESVIRSFRHAVLCGTKPKKAHSQVLMFSNDKDTLRFYANNYKNFKKGSKTYIMLEQTDSALLTESNVYYGNQYEIIARMYWKQRNLLPYKENGYNIKIALIGFDTLGQKLLEYGLCNNIYSLTQNIEYHIWGDSKLYRGLLGSFEMMNNDQIVFHDESWKDSFSDIKNFNRIILACTPSMEIIQSFISLNNNTEIDCYNPHGMLLTDIFTNKNLRTFGEQSLILTEENIKTDKLYSNAKKLNYNFAVLYDKNSKYTWLRPDIDKVMEQLWQNLNGFTKGSNIACTDYHEIRKLIMQSENLSEDTLSESQWEMMSELEHIRWTRYHFINHWTYAEQRDDHSRQHPCLVAYQALSTLNKNKDREMVQMLFELEKKH